MKFFLMLLTLNTLLNPLFCEMHHHYLKKNSIQNNSYTWEEEKSHFDELLISWNAFRPHKGYYNIYARVKTENWSDWLLYATWGSGFQKGTISEKKGIARVYQDAVEILEGFGQAFAIKIVAEEGAELSNIKSLHVCASSLSAPSKVKRKKRNKSYSLAFSPLSQMEIKDERKERLCSPTSTAAVVRYLKKQQELDPLQFAENVWDATFDIYGNWVFNVAEAFHQIHDPSYACWVERLSSFDQVLKSLKKGFPVVISIKGPIPNSALPYNQGHLLVITGYDHKTKEVLCMDPAFQKKEQTKVRYKLKDLKKAWKRRQNIAYIFEKIT